MFFLCVGGASQPLLMKELRMVAVGFRVNNGYKPNLFL